MKQAHALHQRASREQESRGRCARRGLGLATIAVTQAGAPLWAEAGAPERLAAAPLVQGVFWTLVLPLLLFVVAFLSAYALYRHFSAK